MVDAQPHAKTPPPALTTRRVGCVSYLNAKPLIHGLTPPENEARSKKTLGRGSANSVGRDRGKGPAPSSAIDLHLDVPAKLLAKLLAGEVDLALCPVVDFFRCPTPLELVPVGGIACDGPTLTVRLFSRVPIENLTTIHADTDSHTSVALLRVLLHDLFGITPELIHFDPHAQLADGQKIDPSRPPQAMLLIGDKVVTDAPPATAYPHQLDLGGAWHDLTGRPFVFATWMTRRGHGLGDLPSLLATQLTKNLARLDEIVETYAAPHGWPADLAADYLGRILRYRLGDAELDAIAFFGSRLTALGLIDAQDAPPPGISAAATTTAGQAAPAPTPQTSPSRRLDAH